MDANDKKGKVLVVDDNEDVLLAMSLLLEPYVEQVKVTPKPEEIARFIASFDPDAILLDMNFNRDAISGNEGLHWLGEIKKLDPDAVVIFMTAYADTEKAVRAIKAGASDFIPKPWEKDKLLATLSSALKLRQSRREVSALRDQVSVLASGNAHPRIIGESKSMLRIFDMIDKLRDTDANILIRGENGTGKDLVAHAVYRNSPRAGKVFTTIDLGSIPEQLFESELFGYEKGAFTDARRDKPGRLEVARGGTLFLDEIGNLSAQMQMKLLSAIEKKQTVRLGSTRTVNIDVRLISATNADLEDMVERGLMRQDLLYRINTIEIHLPPLRERGNDVIILAQHFLERFAHKYNKRFRSFSRELKDKLTRYPWPGNVRELEHAVERAVILSTDSELMPDDFIFSPHSSGKRQSFEVLNLRQIERDAVEQAVRNAGGNISRAAELLGITRYALYRKIEKMGL